MKTALDRTMHCTWTTPATCGMARSSAREATLSGGASPACPPSRERRGGVLTAIVLAVLCATAAAILPPPVEAGPLTPSTIVYGIAADNNIYSIDPGTGQVTGTVSTSSLALSGSEANAFALDRDRAQIYFLGSDKNLYFWDRPSGALGQVATADDLGLATAPIPRNATFFDNKFWFINSGDNLLQSALITHGTSGLPTAATLQTAVTIAGVPGSLNESGFTNPNDIVFNPNIPMGYGSELDGTFFQVDVSTLLSGTVTYSTLYTAGVNVQLAYDQDFSTLYGVSFATGQWYTMGTTVSGTATETSGAVTPAEYRMADLAGGLAPVPVPEPGSLALAGSGVVVAGVVICRGRRRRRETPRGPRGAR